MCVHVWCVYSWREGVCVQGKCVSLWARRGKERRGGRGRGEGREEGGERRGEGGERRGRGEKGVGVANLLLNPGWSRSWQAAEVRRTAISGLVSTVCRLHRWIIPYICVRVCEVRGV